MGLHFHHMFAAAGLAVASFYVCCFELRAKWCYLSWSRITKWGGSGQYGGVCRLSTFFWPATGLSWGGRHISRALNYIGHCKHLLKYFMLYIGNHPVSFLWESAFEQQLKVQNHLIWNIFTMIRDHMSSVIIRVWTIWFLFFEIRQTFFWCLFQNTSFGSFRWILFSKNEFLTVFADFM